MRKLTLELARALVPHLGSRDRAEILRAYPDLERWAASRVERSCVAWALVVSGEVVAIGGVITSAGEGHLWVAGREGWARRYIRHALRVFDVIKGFGGYAGLRCKCYADNPIACSFAERLGFERRGLDGGIVHYGMAL